MNSIKIPYLPISSFKETGLSEKFAKMSGEFSEGSKRTLNENLDDMFANVALILRGMGMEKYAQLFQEENISLETFLLLKDSDLLELGITSAKDREIIFKNLEIYQLNKKEFTVSENHVEDLKIAKNVFYELLLLQNYCAYVELQMKKHSFIDYRIKDCKETACTYLRAFTESAITQSKIMSSILFDESHSDHLIGKILKMYDLTLPKHLQEKLKGSKKSKKLCVLKVVTVVGLCSFIVYMGKCFMWK